MLRGLRSDLAARGRRALAAAARRGLHVARRSRYDLVARSFYSPVPDLEHLPEDVWDRRSPLPGIRFDSAEQIEFAERELRPFVDEFDLPEKPSGRPGDFYLHNNYYGTVDAEIAYAMVRRFKPRRVIELGSGWSTLVLAHACERNAAEGSPAAFDAFNPHPPEVIRQASLPGLGSHRATPAQDVPLAEFEALGENDVLFVDTTHTVKLAGEVNRIVLEILPLLRAGVLVHFHDIWLPFEYPRVLVEQMEMYWSEQYLLQAFLSMNGAYEILFAVHAAARDHADRLERLVPSYRGENLPSGFWIRRTSDRSAEPRAATTGA